MKEGRGRSEVQLKVGEVKKDEGKRFEGGGMERCGPVKGGEE